MVKVIKKPNEIKCPWCNAKSTLVFVVESNEEYCLGCKRSLTDKDKVINKDTK